MRFCATKSKAQAMTDAVTSNTDLARRLISMGGTELLAASKSIRNAHQPCTRKYERWREHGCKADSDEDRMCLQAIGGLESTLCQGEYTLTSMESGSQVVTDKVPATAMADRVRTFLTTHKVTSQTRPMMSPSYGWAGP